MSEALTRSERSLSSLAADFEKFAQDTDKRSVLYSTLSKQITGDSDLLRLAAKAQANQPAPNLLFAAVQHCLFDNPGEALVHFYKNLTPSPRLPEDVFPIFKEFCIRHQQTLDTLLHTKRVQTNEVGRCSYLFPAFCEIYERVNHQAIALIEVGTSAGLNLNWDRYAYLYDPASAVDNQSSPVIIRSSFIGKGKPYRGGGKPEIFSRIGVDVNIVDVNKVDDAKWLLALVWPEQEERRRNLVAAIDLWKRHPHPLIEADANLVLLELLYQIPIRVPVVVFNTHTLYQFPKEKRDAFTQTIQRKGEKRILFHLSAEWLGTPTPELWLHSYALENSSTERLALVDQHGEWIEWQKES